MAKVTNVQRSVTTLTLELDEDEALAVLSVIGRVGGGGCNKYRKAMDKVYGALQEQFPFSSEEAQQARLLLNGYLGWKDM